MKKPHQDENSNPPAGYDPATDQDAHWKTIARLMREADAPEIPPAAYFSAIRDDLRRQLRAEGVLQPRRMQSTESHDGFLPWLRSLLVGGGPGAQVVRFAAVGAIAFIAGSNFFTAEQSPPVVESTTMEVASATATPERPTSAPTGGVPIARSIMDSPISWQSTFPSSGMPITLQQQGMMVPVTSGHFGGATSFTQDYSVRTNELATQAFDHVQAMRLVTATDDNDRMQADLRRLDLIMRQMMDGSDLATNTRLRAGELYQAAEQALVAQRYGEAQQLLEEVASLLPGTSLAALSTFQIGRTAYERQNDFQLALRSFERLQQQGGDRLLTEAQRTQLNERLALLRETANENWLGLRHLVAAEQSNNALDAANALARAINETGSQRLAADAAQRLAEVTIQDAMSEEINPLAAVQVIHQRVLRSIPSPQTARIQLAAAEIVLLRMQNLSDARVEYRTVLDLKPDERTARTALMRLGALDASQRP